MSHHTTDSMSCWYRRSRDYVRDWCRQIRCVRFFNSRSAAQTLKEQRIHESCGNQLQREGRRIAEVVIVPREFNSLMRLQSNRSDVAAQSEAGLITGSTDPLRIVGLNSVVDGQIALVEDAVLHEHEWGIKLPLKGRECHANCSSEAERIVATAFKGDEGTAFATIGIVVPRGWVRSRAGEDPRRHTFRQFAANIAAVQDVETASPWKIKPSHSSNPVRVWTRIRALTCMCD